MAKRLSKKAAKKRKAAAKRAKKQDIGHFLPAAPEVVRAIAMQGSTDDEIAFMMGLDPKVIKKWREFYPSFDKALEEGRTVADMEVVQALHKNATGATIRKDVPIKVKTATGRGAYEERVEIHTITEERPPETNAIKMWLQNRDPERWSRTVAHLRVTGKDGEPTIDGIKPETKMEVMSSILSLIQPKPDGV